MKRIGMFFAALAALVLIGLAPMTSASASTPTSERVTVSDFTDTIPAGYGVDLESGKIVKPNAKDMQYLALTCPSGYICFIDNNPPSGAAEPVSQNWTGCRTLTTLNNRTSYVWNATNYTWHVWDSNTACDHPQGTGTIYPNTKAGMSSVWNDKITNYHRH